MKPTFHVYKEKPEVGKVYFISQHCMLHILEGNGAIEVDFQTYSDWDDKLIFLEEGQYIKFLHGDFVVRKIEFDNEEVFRKKAFRVLFKHLISLGHIDFKKCTSCQEYLNNTLSHTSHSLLDISVDHWYWQNPFQASSDEYQIIFDLKELVDAHYMEPIGTGKLLSLIQQKEELNVQKLVGNKLGLSVHELLARKKMSEGKKSLAFKNESVKEIAYKLGYKDPAYFNRVFKSQTGMSPGGFRDEFLRSGYDPFIEELYDLIKTFHEEHRDLDFYANKMQISKNNLSNKVRLKLNNSLGQILRQEIIRTARIRLLEGMSIQETAFSLGFEEPQHFSAFFKKYTGGAPSGFRNNSLNLP